MSANPNAPIRPFRKAKKSMCLIPTAVPSAWATSKRHSASRCARSTASRKTPSTPRVATSSTVNICRSPANKPRAHRRGARAAASPSEALFPNSISRDTALPNGGRSAARTSPALLRRLPRTAKPILAIIKFWENNPKYSASPPLRPRRDSNDAFPIHKETSMKMHYYTLPATALAIGLALSACYSGGGSGAASAGNASTTQGVVTGFGSVFVNGIEYEVAGDTDIQLDGERATESALQVGMLVTLNGTVNPDGKTGTAHSIKFADQMKGVVDTNHIAANGVGTITVMGQTVTVTAETVFESKVAGIISPDLIQAGNIVEVSGYASSGGAITATRIEVKAAAQTAGREIEVKGIVSNLTATTFTLGALTVD